MSKSIFTTLTDLAKGSLVTTTGAAQVDMGQPEQVKTAQQAARVRASKIRMNSPTAAMPKSMKKKGIKYEGAEKSASALSDLVRKSEDFDMAAFNRENPVFERDERNVPLKTYDQKISPPKGAKKPSSAVAERKMKSTRTKKAFTMLPPGKAKGSESPTPTVKRKPSRPSADQQAYRMKSASKKKDLDKSLDPLSLPPSGSYARNKYDDAYKKWKTKPRPDDYQPLSDEERKKLNRWAALGHKASIHQLMDDYNWKDGDKPDATEWPRH